MQPDERAVWYGVDARLRLAQRRNENVLIARALIKLSAPQFVQT